MLGEKANIFKARYLYGRHGRICGGHKREGGSAIPGKVSIQRGAWWNSGASHMNEAFPKRFFDSIGLVSLQNHRLQFICGS